LKDWYFYRKINPMKNVWKYLMILITMNVNAQNLVPNPSFEVMDYCPTTLTQIDAATGWISVNALGTPDYYNACSPTIGIAPPATYFAYQAPLTGNAFAGFSTIYYTGGNDPRENIGCALNQMLQQGIRYYVSFYVARGYAIPQHYTLATNKIGALFSTLAYSSTNPAPENNYAHVFTDSIIVDTLNWVQVKGSFLADSAYQYINIGNFFDNAHTDTLNFGDQLAKGSYYLIDNVCVSEDSNLCYYPISISENEFDNAYSIYPNPVSSILTININQDNAWQFNNLNLFDCFGRKLQTFFLSRIDVLKINVSSLVHGFYFLEFSGDRYTYRKKIFISH
jgi:hypothetical protein